LTAGQLREPKEQKRHRRLLARLVLGLVAALAFTALALGVSAWSISGPTENPPTRPFWNLGHRHANGQQCPEQHTDPGTSRGTVAGQGRR
jgi:hypothetical protein